jgi:predicted SAM-dependent methyltransferase
MSLVTRAIRKAFNAARLAIGGRSPSPEPSLELSRVFSLEDHISRKNKATIDLLLRDGMQILLELGAGGHRRLKGWTTVDLWGDCDLILDITKPLPFPDNSVDKIYSSHVLEHFTYPNPLSRILAESVRILKPGGIFSVAVPNARLYIEAYLNPQGFRLERYCRFDTGLTYKAKIDYINCIAYMAGHHKHMFDEENLPMVLKGAGFGDVKLRDFDPSLDLEARREGTIYAEAQK